MRSRNFNASTILTLIVRLAILAAIILGIIAFVPSVRARGKADKTEAGISFLKSQESRDISHIDKEFRKRAVQSEISDMDVWQKLNYFDTYLMGDSRVVGFLRYDIEEDHVWADASLTIKYIEERIPDIRNAKPANLVLSFGMNDLGMYQFDPDNYWETAPEYCEAYMEYINMIHDASPETNVYVNSMLPATELGTSRQERWLLIPEWNDYMKEYFANIPNVTFIDVTQIALDNLDAYQDDGVHVYGDIYIYWAEAIMEAIESNL